jgi:hypothetical protein
MASRATSPSATRCTAASGTSSPSDEADEFTNNDGACVASALDGPVSDYRHELPPEAAEDGAPPVNVTDEGQTSARMAAKFAAEGTEALRHRPPAYQRRRQGLGENSPPLCTSA